MPSKIKARNLAMKTYLLNPNFLKICLTQCIAMAFRSASADLPTSESSKPGDFIFFSSKNLEIQTKTVRFLFLINFSPKT